MKIRTVTLILVLGALTFAACVDKKKESKTTKTEAVEHGHEHDANNDHKHTEKDAEAEKRRLDSIRQVKEHGHAH